jgi:hypothetical protein
MNSKTKITAIIIIAIIGSIGVVGAVTYFTVNQTLTIPTVIQLFKSDGSTPIANGADITSFWTYSTGAFTLSFVLKNPGSTTITPTVTFQTVAGWTFTTTALNSIPSGQTLAVTATATPPSTTPGTTSGAFAISIGA